MPDFEDKAGQGQMAMDEPQDDGMGNLGGEAAEELAAPITIRLGDASDDLDIRTISNSFADKGIACAFVLPDPGGPEAELPIVQQRILNASRLSDMVVFDWFLRDGNSVFASDLLKEIARLDSQDNGHLRLICVYTGQSVDRGILDDAKAALREGGISLVDIDPTGSRLISKSERCLLIVLNKKEVLPADLPETLLKEFATLADGILPTFALAALGSIRSNAHHMITRFCSDMDSAYIANHLITYPKEDAEAIVSALFVAECQAAIEYEKISEEFLGNNAVEHWLLDRKAPLKKDITTKNGIVDASFLANLVKFGVKDNKITNDQGTKKYFEECERIKLCDALSVGTSSAQDARRNFARLVGLVRESFGKNRHAINEKWKPCLTTGTILYSTAAGQGSEARYFICLTPACSTVRLVEPKKFIFIANSLEPKGLTSLVVTDPTGQDQPLFFDKKEPDLVTFIFSPDPSEQRVCGVFDDSIGAFKMISTEPSGKEFLWIGDMRQERVNKDLSDLISNWVSIGINDFEMLRLAGRRGAAPF